MSQLKKRHCKRFSIPGTVVSFKRRTWFLQRKQLREDIYPVVDLSKGGLKFLCDQRLKPGARIVTRITIPGHEQLLDVMASVRWIAKNPEQSYKYQIGISFNPYGQGRNLNNEQVLQFFESLE